MTSGFLEKKMALDEKNGCPYFAYFAGVVHRERHLAAVEGQGVAGAMALVRGLLAIEREGMPVPVGTGIHGARHEFRDRAQPGTTLHSENLSGVRGLDRALFGRGAAN